MQCKEYKYFAFISYSRVDSREARWLQRRLEWYPFPVKLVKEENRPMDKKYIRPIFLDKTDLTARNMQFWEDIEQALRVSRFLIVLCSPTSAKSTPLNREVRYFLNDSGRENALSYVIVVILKGTVGKEEATECRCPALRELGHLVQDRHLPSMEAGEGEAERDGWESGFVRVVKLLLALETEAPIRSHIRAIERKAARRAFMLAAVFLLLASVAIAGGIVARKQRQEAVRQRTLAQQKTKEAESESRRSEAGRLLAEANSALRDRPQLGLLLMVEAMNVNLRTAQPPLIMTEQALWNTLNVVGGLSLPTRGRGLRCAAISPNGHWLAAGDWDAGVRLWNLETSNVLAGVRILNAHSNGVSALTMSPDSRWLASGYCDGNVVLWDLQVTDSSASARILRGHTAWINALAMCPDGHWLATASDDTSVRLWDLTRMGDSSRSLVLGVQGSPVTALAMSPDGKWLAAGAEDGNAALWNLSNVQEAASTARILSGHTNRVNAVEISSDSRWLVTGSKDGTARIWDLQEITISNNAKVLAEHVRAVNVVKISPDCRWVATGGFDGSVRLWDLQAKDIKKSVVTLQAHAGGVVISTKVPDKNVPQIHVLHQVLKSGELKKRFEAAKQYNIEPIVY